MKARLLVAAVCVPLLLAILYLCPFWATVVLVALVCAVGAYELLCCVGLGGHRRVMFYCLLISIATPFWCWFGSPAALGAWGLFCLFLLLFIEAILSNNELKYTEISTGLISALVIPYFLSAFVRLGMMDGAEVLLLLPLVIAFIADGAALFCGMAFGKHKLAPKISPKKTIEGAIGGVVFSTVFTVIYAFVAREIWDVETNVLLFAICGLVGSVVSMIGDLAFSLIKRHYGIKDYGKLLPGHGGILDRVDSVVFAAPFVELMALVLPLVR